MTSTTGASTQPALLIGQDGPLRLVTLNRPDVLNAADESLHARLAQVWHELASDPDCRAVVLTGAGTAFCAGGDLGLLRKMHLDSECRERILVESSAIVQGMIHFPWPIVAAVNGPAVGLGCSLAGLCDVVLIEEGAYLADTHVSVGLVAGDGGALTWPLLTSLLKAKEYLFTGDRIPAEKAVELGFANRLVPAGTSVQEALALAQRLASQPPQALRDTKRSINRHLERAVLDVLQFAVMAESQSSASLEHGAILDRLQHQPARRANG